MARLAMSIAIGMSVAAAAPASADPAFDRLEAALPAGWTLLATGSELVIRHDRPCYLTGGHRDGAPATGAAAATDAAGAPGGSDVPATDRDATSALAAGGGPLVTIELRYHLQPRWTAAQLTAAKAANDQLAGELHTLATRYRIDAIHTGPKGRPLPVTADEHQRLASYEAGRARLTARRVRLPRCMLGEAAVFDGDDTYAQLALQVDPPEVMTQAHRIVELMKQHCR